MHSFLPPRLPSLASSPALNQAIAQTLIIACNEPTQQLSATLRAEGLAPEILRQQPQPEHQDYARSTLALLNHHQAWERAKHHDGLTLIVEADFVPVRDIGNLPLPFAFNASSQERPVGIGWLYTCAAQIYSVSETGHGNGFSTSMVAYIITPASAIALLEIFYTLEQVAKPTRYRAWDSTLDHQLRQRGFDNFIPFRNYGEHGGRPNPEHKHHGLSATHRADVLYGPLAFPPAYVLPSVKVDCGQLTACNQTLDTMQIHDQGKIGTLITQHIRYILIRSYARSKGIGRLIFGRFLHTKVAKESTVPLWLLHFAIRRHFSLYL